MSRTKPGKQQALFSDQEVRRDYFASKQWVQQHMKLKVHLTGFAVAYEAIEHRRDPDRPPEPGRDQGSLNNWQKHAIADAVEWIRRNSRYKPRIMCVTCPGFLAEAHETNYIKRLTANLRNGYGMGEYVWVREFTKRGFPHYHFIADIDKFDPVQLSLYWSGLWGKDNKNSIRLGTRPHPVTKKRKFWIDSHRMAYYMSKYLGKDRGVKYANDDGEVLKRKPYRSFAISQRARKESQPLIYTAHATELYTGLHQRQFLLSDDQAEEGIPFTVNPHNYRWKWTGHGQTYVGFVKEHTEK